MKLRLVSGDSRMTPEESRRARHHSSSDGCASDSSIARPPLFILMPSYHRIYSIVPIITYNIDMILNPQEYPACPSPYRPFQDPLLGPTPPLKTKRRFRALLCGFLILSLVVTIVVLSLLLIESNPSPNLAQEPNEDNSTVSVEEETLRIGGWMN